MTYGTDLCDGRLAASYLNRILRGASLYGASGASADQIQNPAQSQNRQGTRH